MAVETYALLSISSVCVEKDVLLTLLLSNMSVCITK